MKKLLTVLLTILLTTALLAAACPTTAAEGTYYTDDLIITCEMDTPIGSDSAEKYIKRAFGLIGDAPRMRIAPLTGANETVYNALASMIQEVAAGRQSSTICNISADSLGMTEYSYTAEQLGVPAIVENGRITEAAKDALAPAVLADIGLDLSLIISRLKISIPYDMFWVGLQYSYGLSCGSNGSTIYVPTGSDYTVYIFVSSDYSVSGAEGTTNYKTSNSDRVNEAAARATAIVAACAGQPVYDRLVYYRDAICEAVDYDDDAPDNKPYGDPWQAVFVFDDDSRTKVVCEGYSKAFKYLCDLSHFSGVNVSLVTGYMQGGTGAGPHMWNLVSIGGKNYLVDVTNCDAGTIGAPDKLFMAGYSDYYKDDNQWSYIYKVDEGDDAYYITYTYDREITDLYTEEELTVEDHDYDPSAVPTRTVFFEANGGSGDMEDQVVNEGAPTKLNPNTYTSLSNFHFVGWNTKSDGSGDAYDDEAEVTLYDDLTLYAIWERDMWTVTFVANNGTEDTAEQKIPKGILTETELNANSFDAPEYYHFTGWNTEKDGSGISYADKEKVLPEENLTLYAIWAKNTCTVTFVANNGTEETAEQIVYEDDPTQLTANTFTPPEHYHFAGWNTKPDGSGDVYDDETEVTLEADLTLYAVWEEDTSFTISFVANGGSGEMADQIIYEGDTAQLTANTFTPPEHYHFAGWNTKPDGSGDAYDDKDEVTPEADLTLYAVWEEDDHFTVSFAANGGSGEMADQIVYEGDTARLTANTFMPPEHYHFAGWNTKPDGLGDAYEDEEEVTLDEDLTLYAVWEEDEEPETCTVYFEINNGVGDMEDQIVYVGVPTKLNPNTYTPQEGYHFVGWNTEADGLGDAYDDEAEVTLDGDLILYAIWDNDAWTVTFMANNGTEDTAEQRFPKNHLEPTALEPDHSFDAPEYYHFKEWNTKANGWGGTSYADKAKIKPDADMTLYAIWEPDMPRFSLEVFDLSSGQHMTGGVIRLSAVFRYGDESREMPYEDCIGGSNYSGMGSATVTVEAVPADNYMFIGWYLGEEDSSSSQALKPVGECLSSDTNWSFVAEGDMSWSPYCAVFRYVPSVFGTAEFTLPDDLVRVEESAFEGISAVSVYVPDDCGEIDTDAFKDCISLQRIRLPFDCDINDYAFDGCKTDPYDLECSQALVIYAPAGGQTQDWAEEHHILFVEE